MTIDEVTCLLTSNGLADEVVPVSDGILVDGEFTLALTEDAVAEYVAQLAQRATNEFHEAMVD